MDVSFSNVVEGTRQYFQGLPTASPNESSAPRDGSGAAAAQPFWPQGGAPPAEESSLARSGAPALPDSRPPSVAAAHPDEPAPHIIHKATVMQQAHRKQMEEAFLNAADDLERPSEIHLISPPTHIIPKPPHAMPDALAYRQHAYARPRSYAPPPGAPDAGYAAPQPPASSVASSTVRAPTPTPTHRPPSQQFAPHVAPPPPPQQSYSRMSASGHRVSTAVADQPPAASKMRASPAHRPYPGVAGSPDARVPPIVHPGQTAPARPSPSATRPSSSVASPSSTAAQHAAYAQARSAYVYEQQALAARKAEAREAYQSYGQPARAPARTYAEMRPDVQPTHSPRLAATKMPPGGGSSLHAYPPRPPEQHASRIVQPGEYGLPTKPTSDPNRSNALRNNYQYITTAQSYNHTIISNASSYQSSGQTYPSQQPTYQPTSVLKPVYEGTPKGYQPAPARSGTSKTSYASQQQRMTVSVTSLVNQIRQQQTIKQEPAPQQLRQKRESPLDLSVKTVKNSADSTATDETETVIYDKYDQNKMHNVRLKEALPAGYHPVNARHVGTTNHIRNINSHKVDFSPNFRTTYSDRSPQRYREMPPGLHDGKPHPAHGYVNHYEAHHQKSSQKLYPETYTIDNRYQPKQKYPASAKKVDPSLPRIDLTIAMGKEHTAKQESKPPGYYTQEDSRKRPIGHVNSNIPEKILRYETWSADSRLDRGSLTQSNLASEQQKLISRPVYSYSNYKQYEAYQNTEYKPAAPPNSYQTVPQNHQYQMPYPGNTHKYSVSQSPNLRYADRSAYTQVVSKSLHSKDVMDCAGGPADKRVLSILRNSLETRHMSDIPKPMPHIGEPIIIDADEHEDSVIEITDLTKENESDKEGPKRIVNNHQNQHIQHKLQMPKAVDSIRYDSDSSQKSNVFESSTTNSPENRNDSDMNLDFKKRCSDLDVAAVLAARIRTKAELKGFTPLERLSRENIVLAVEVKKEKETEDSTPVICELATIQPTVIQAVPTKQEKVEDMEVSYKDDDDCILSEELPAIPKVEILDEPTDDVSTKLITIDEVPNSKAIENQLEKPISSDPVNAEEDSIWTETLDDFLEQLKSGCGPKKKIKKKKSLEAEIFIDQVTILESASKAEDAVELEIPMQVSEVVKEKSVDVRIERSVVVNVVDIIKSDRPASALIEKIKKEVQETDKIKEEIESTDDDEPLIKSKLIKDKIDLKEKNRLLKSHSPDIKSVFVKLECCDIVEGEIKRQDMLNNFLRDTSLDRKCKKKKNNLRSNSVNGLEINEKRSNEKEKKTDNGDSSSQDSDSDDLSVARRLRVRKSLLNTKVEEIKPNKASSKVSPKKQEDKLILKKPGFGDGSDFHPGWEEELYKYKRSLRMPSRLINVPKIWPRISTSLPDLDPPPVSPAPSSSNTDEIYIRPKYAMSGCDITEKGKYLDSDLESNSSFSVNHKISYDSEASCSTIISTASKTITKRNESILDVLIQKCGKKEESKKKTKGDKDNRPKTIPKSSNTIELLATPSLSLERNGKSNKGNSQLKKDKVMEDIFYLSSFRKETVSNFRDAFINTTDGVLTATEEFAPVVLKSRTRTESRVLKHRATIKEVFGDERPASAPPISFITDEQIKTEVKVEEPVSETKQKQVKKVNKDKPKTNTCSIRDGLRSTRLLKRNDAKGRFLRLKKRNNMLKALASKKGKGTGSPNNSKVVKINQLPGEKIDGKAESEPPCLVTKKRLKRLFARRKFSSGFDYIRKKKKIIKKDEDGTKVQRRPVISKPNPESVHDIQKEIKGWFINKSIGETALHRAARLGYTDCVAYCLETLTMEVSASDNAGYTPLHVAAARGHLHIARLLLQYGANVSAAARGGIRPLHEACENEHVEVIRLLLSYGADPLLATYAGQTPASLADGLSAKLLRQHIGDIQGTSVDPWYFEGPSKCFDPVESGCDCVSGAPIASPPPPPAPLEITASATVLPPLYSLRPAPGQPHADGLWCLLQDLATILQIKSRDTLLKQIHCGSGSPKDSLQELKTQEFLERAQCHQLIAAGEKINIRASKIALVRYTDKVKQLLDTETVIVR